MDSQARLVSGLGAFLCRPPTPRELDAFSKYLALLVEWNRVYSLTGYREPARIIDKLFLDSLLFLRFLPTSTSALLDLGSGTGIPGIPLKIIKPAYRLTLIEARRRRGSFLLAAVRGLSLEGVKVLTGRAESLIQDSPSLEGQFDAVVTRASGRVELIAPVALRFLKPGGRFIASGPPLAKPVVGSSTPGAWQSVISPVSGLGRRFLVVEKIV